MQVLRLSMFEAAVERSTSYSASRGRRPRCSRRGGRHCRSLSKFRVLFWGLGNSAVFSCDVFHEFFCGSSLLSLRGGSLLEPVFTVQSSVFASPNTRHANAGFLQACSLSLAQYADFGYNRPAPCRRRAPEKTGETNHKET